MGTMGWIAFVLVIIGGLNWGLVGAFEFNLVEEIFGMSLLATIIYILVGLSAIYLIFAGSKKETAVSHTTGMGSTMGNSMGSSM